MSKELLERCRVALLDLEAEYKGCSTLLRDLDAAIAQEGELLYEIQTWTETNGHTWSVPTTKAVADRWATLGCPVRIAAQQPPAISGMPEFQEPIGFITRRDVNAYAAACYTAGRRQGLEEAAAVIGRLTEKVKSV